MTVKYFVDKAGNYIGGFEGATPAKGSIQVPSPPENGHQIWKFESQVWGAIPLATPRAISDRQFFHILAMDGLITQAEALAAVKMGDAPAAFEAFVASLPESDRFSARMLLEGATTFERDHPLTDAFGTMYGMTPDQIDDLWRRASAL